MAVWTSPRMTQLHSFSTMTEHLLLLLIGMESFAFFISLMIQCRIWLRVASIKQPRLADAVSLSVTACTALLNLSRIATLASRYCCQRSTWTAWIKPVFVISGYYLTSLSCKPASSLHWSSSVLTAGLSGSICEHSGQKRNATSLMTAKYVG